MRPMIVSVPRCRRVPARAKDQSYDSVVKRMGMGETAEFTRLYMVPGMQHCGGGPGPDNFGQNGPS
jgi:feruloyl esterase